jgi:hypothetical protein
MLCIFCSLFLGQNRGLIMYQWLPLSAYKCWQSLVDFVEKVLREFGENYVINFV